MEDWKERVRICGSPSSLGTCHNRNCLALTRKWSVPTCCRWHGARSRSGLAPRRSDYGWVYALTEAGAAEHRRVADPKISHQPGMRQRPATVCAVGFRRGAPAGVCGLRPASTGRSCPAQFRTAPSASSLLAPSDSDLRPQHGGRGNLASYEVSAGPKSGLACASLLVSRARSAASTAARDTLHDSWLAWALLAASPSRKLSPASPSSAARPPDPASSIWQCRLAARPDAEMRRHDVTEIAVEPASHAGRLARSAVLVMASHSSETDWEPSAGLRPGRAVAGMA